MERSPDTRSCTSWKFSMHRFCRNTRNEIFGGVPQCSRNKERSRLLNLERISIQNRHYAGSGACTLEKPPNHVLPRGTAFHVLLRRRLSSWILCTDQSPSPRDVEVIRVPRTRHNHIFAIFTRHIQQRNVLRIVTTLSGRTEV